MWFHMLYNSVPKDKWNLFNDIFRFPTEIIAFLTFVHPILVEAMLQNMLHYLCKL